jgi:hypothetical protein
MIAVVLLMMLLLGLVVAKEEMTQPQNRVIIVTMTAMAQ